MSRHTSRLLCATYGALFVWLAWCVVMSARNDAPWTCVAFVVASGLVVAAVVREGDLDAALRREVVRAQHDALLHPADADAGVAAVALAGWCCDAWAATAGAEHDQACRRHTQRSNPA